MAVGQATDRWPSIGVEAIHVVERIDFAHDRRNVFVHVAGEHAGVEQARIFIAEENRSVCGAHRPLRVRLERVTPVQVWAHARDHPHAALPSCSDTLTKEIAAV